MTDRGGYGYAAPQCGIIPGMGINDIKEEIDKLTADLKIYQDKYYKEGVSLVSDSEYDRLTDRLIVLEKEHPEFQHPDLNYVVVFCSIAKKHEKAFLQCMADLDRALRIEGHDDYKEAIDFVSGLFDRK